MSDTADSTLNALKALIAAFQTGATPVAVKTSTAEAASLPPKFPGPDDKKPADNSARQKTEYNERGRLPASRTQTEGNYARQYLEGYVGESEDPSDKKTEPGCPASLHISLFFDGTCCNEEDGDEVYGSRNPPLTNIGRLYHAANWLDKAEDDGYFSYYFPGCGARFPEIGEEHYSLDGELFANGGEDRINQALLKTYSSICYAVNKKAIEDSELDIFRPQMATVWPFSRLTQKFNRKSALDKFCDDHLGAVVNQWPRQPTRLHIQRSQRRIAKIKLFVYGYCRGASTARAFARGLESLLDDAKMPLDATNMLPAGTVVPGGPTLMGIPISIEFMGLLDSVSAVGVPHILPSANAEVLRGALALYDWTDNEMNRRRLQAIVDVSHCEVERFAEGHFLRGVQIEVTLDGNGFAGHGDICLFGEMLNRFFALYTDIHLFNRLILILQPTGERLEWQENHKRRIPG
ncbi:type VI secretion system baseplate subunit TssF [Klebsiella aerogenes]|uniref:type VI secretion system baseplate subunit TssF n=1 Tax=Klebsiella aerogenes TaxID=548 RepID=UPI0037ABADE1